MKTGVGQQRRARQPGFELCQPPELRPPAVADLRENVLAALRDLIGQAEQGQLPLAAAGDATVTLAVASGPVRLTLIIDVSGAGHGLSPRELQIARLVASGATNQAIARSLDISAWTVSTHLRRIFAKLSVCTRAEMVAQVFGTAHLLSRE
jgi:DNA-binding CsgD family transcriptional regulator